MYIVNLNGLRHSAWNTLEQAEHQEQVLHDVGYKEVYVYFDETTQTENGHYYI